MDKLSILLLTCALAVSGVGGQRSSLRRQQYWDAERFRQQLDAALDQIPVRIREAQQPATQQSTQACWITDPAPCYPASPYRTVDGSCNNLQNPTWGQSLRMAGRQLPAQCSAGDFNGPRQTGVTGRPLVSARKSSTTLHPLVQQRDLRKAKLTVMHMTWGQFIDHDITHLPMPMPPFDCCNKPEHQRNPECIPIPIPSDDPAMRGRQCMELRRSMHIKPGQCGNVHREQINNLTSYIDGGGVYGNWESRARQQRAFKMGLLRMSDHGQHMAVEKPGTPCDIPPRNHPDKRCFMAGDKRSNEQGGLTALHVTFVRYHNQIAQAFYQQMKNSMPYANEKELDEKVFQETRRIIGAVLQVINYAEYLPKVIGEAQMYKWRLHIQSNLPQSRRGKPTYNRHVDATASNVFATAAFRFGHSQVGFGIQPRDGNFRNSSHFVSFDELFNQPTSYRMFQNDNILRGMMIDATPEVEKFSPEARDKLHMRTFNNKPLDLPAINAQRGRDHCLPGYNAWRRMCGLREVTFDNMPDHTDEQRRKFKTLYDHPDDIDLFPAAITERHVSHNAEVGPTFACILGDQFQRLKEGDRFWFENQGTYPNSFTDHQIRQLSQIKLSKVICDTTPNTDRLPMDAFIVNSQFVRCADLPGLDLNNWLNL